MLCSAPWTTDSWRHIGLLDHVLYTASLHSALDSLTPLPASASAAKVPGSSAHAWRGLLRSHPLSAGGASSLKITRICHSEHCPIQLPAGIWAFLHPLLLPRQRRTCSVFTFLPLRCYRRVLQSHLRDPGPSTGCSQRRDLLWRRVAA